MKINKIHIISFGGLKDYTLKLEDGLNCIYGENERGKSTLMSFIKMMFYGNSYSGTVLQNNLRKKYTPWDGSAMAGIIEFEKNGKIYRLEREFKKSNSTDKVTLTDLSIGEKQSVSGDIGNELFGLSAGAFERSLFIGQLGFPESDSASEGELNGRLSNMVSTGDEMISLQEVTSKIEKKRFSLISKSGKTGEFYRLSKITEELKQKLEASVSANKKYNEGKQKLKEFSQETEIIAQRALKLKERLDKEQDIKNAQKLRDYISTKEALEKLKSKLTLTDGSPADENFLRRLKFAISKQKNALLQVQSKKKEIDIFKNQLELLLSGPKLQNGETQESIGEEISLLNSKLSSLEKKTEEADEKIALLKEKSQSSKAHFNPILLGLGIILAVLSPITFFTLNMYVPFILCGLGIILIAISFIAKPKTGRREQLCLEEINSLEELLSNQNAHIEELKQQISEKTARAEAIRISATASLQVIEEQRRKLGICEKELADLEAAEIHSVNELKEILSFLKAKTESIEDAVSLLENATARQKELKQQISFLLNDLNNITYDEAKIKLSEIENDISDDGTDLSEIKSDFEKLSKEITQRLTLKASAETELRALLSGIEVPAVIETQLKEKTERLNLQKEFCDSADIALQVLQESFSELRSTFGSKLEKKTADIFSAITKGAYSDVTVSKSFKINVSRPENPISREAEYLSSGAYDQLYLSLRLAIIGLLEENMPIFLDDSLTQYDDLRAKRTLEFLKNETESSQAIMFTCHKAIADISKNLNISVNKLV